MKIGCWFVAWVALCEGSGFGQDGGPLEFNETPSNVAAEVAFPHLKIQRPVAIAHAGDGSGRPARTSPCVRRRS